MEAWKPKTAGAGPRRKRKRAADPDPLSGTVLLFGGRKLLG